MTMTPIEREYYIEFIHEEAQKTKEYMDKLKQEREQTTRSR